MKEKREANFTKTEISLLVDIAKRYKYIVESKQTDAQTWKDKNDAWKKITEEFNAVSENSPRSTKSIRSKYDTIKKNLRKKFLLLKSVQTKTFRGQCPVTLNPRERKDPPNTMASLDSRFDKDSEYAELGSSGLRQLTKQLDIKQEELGPNVTEEGTIEFLDEQDYDLLQYLKMAQNLKVPEVASVSSEKSSNTNRTHIIKKISTVDSDHGNITQKEMDAKFILKNQQAKTTANPCIIQENLQLRNDILVLQKNLLAQEMKAKAEINKLTIENLKLDLQIKQMTQQKLEANIIDDDCNL